MSYWIIQAQENPAEPRETIGRREWRSNTLAETLADRRHDVVRWRSAFSHQSKQFLEHGNVSRPHDNYTQNFIDCPAYQRHVGLKRIRNHAALATNFGKVSRQGPPPKLIHVGNVPIDLAHAAVRYGKEVGCPTIIDIRDLWPDIYVDLLPNALSGLREPMLKLLKFSAFRLRWAIRNATAITALTQPYMDWAMDLGERTQTPKDAIFPMCYPQRDEQPSDVAMTALRKRLGVAPDDIVAVYLGNIGYQSDFELVIEAAKQLSSRFPKFKVVIAGSGPKEEALKELTNSVPNVIIPGWLRGEEMSAILHLSDIGLIAFHPVPNYLKNIPNKYSEYLAGGLAVACGLGGEMGRLTDQHGCGFTYPPGDLDTLCDRLAHLLSDHSSLKAIGEKSLALYQAKFTSERVFPAFADHLEMLANK